MKAFLTGVRNHFHASPLAGDIPNGMHLGEAPPGTAMPYVTVEVNNSDYDTEDTEGNQVRGRDVEMHIQHHDPDTLLDLGERLRELYRRKRTMLPTGHIMACMVTDETFVFTGQKDEEARPVFDYGVVLAFMEYQDDGD